jgi:hypothetical protein
MTDIDTLGVKLKNRRIVLHHHKGKGVVLIQSKKLIEKDCDISGVTDKMLPTKSVIIPVKSRNLIISEYAISEEGAEALLALLIEWHKNKNND